MQTLEQQISQQAHGLPEAAQREVPHFIEFIRSRYPAAPPTIQPTPKRKTSWSATPLWVFRAQSSTDSGPNRPLIPGPIVH